MSRFLAFCLLLIPLAQGLSVLTDSAPSLTVMKTNRELEEEIYENITVHLKPQSVFIPHVTNDNGEHTPLHVKVNSYVRDIEMKNVDTNLFDMKLDLIFRQKWNDKRLAYDVSHHPDFKYVSLNSNVKSIWKPDTFFDKSVKEEFHLVTAPNVLLWVYPDGNVLYSTRLTITIRCTQNDTVAASDDKEEEKKSCLVCPVRIASYGNSHDKLVYEWDDAERAPVESRESLYLPHFTLDKITTDEAHVSKSRVGDWSSLIAKFHFSHK